MSTKRWVLLGLALVMVLSLLAGCTTQLKVPASTPQVNEPLQSPGEGEGFVDSLWELIDFWEGKVQLEDLVGPERDALIEEALDVIYGTPEILEVIETEIIEMDLAGAKPILADTPDGKIAIVSIPAIPETEDSKAEIIVALPESGPPLVMGFITNIDVIDIHGRVVVYDAFLIRAWWLVLLLVVLALPLFTGGMDGTPGFIAGTTGATGAIGLPGGLSKLVLAKVKDSSSKPGTEDNGRYEDNDRLFC